MGLAVKWSLEMTSYLLCVVIVFLAYILGVVQGRRPPNDERPSGSIVSVLGLFASLVLGAILWSVLRVVAESFGIVVGF